MNRDKQIEEMANIINEMDEPNAHYYDENLEQHEAFADCFTIAKHLYEQGYRKADEVAREIFAEIGKILYKYDKIAERDKSEYGELIVMDIGCVIAELKNKYAEGEG